MKGLSTVVFHIRDEFMIQRNNKLNKLSKFLSAVAKLKNEIHIQGRFFNRINHSTVDP